MCSLVLIKVWLALWVKCSACFPPSIAQTFCMVKQHYRDNSYYSYHASFSTPWISFQLSFPLFFFFELTLASTFVFVLTTFLHPSTVLFQRQKVLYPCLWDWINPSLGPPTSVLNHWAQPLNSAWGDYGSFLSVFPLTCFLQLPYRSSIPLMPDTLCLPLLHLCRSPFWSIPLLPLHFSPCLSCLLPCPRVLQLLCVYVSRRPSLQLTGGRCQLVQRPRIFQLLLHMTVFLFHQFLNVNYNNRTNTKVRKD